MANEVNTENDPAGKRKRNFIDSIFFSNKISI
jgi:hypothetical protein